VTFPFGKYRGQPLAAIPKEYLLWAVRIAHQPLRGRIEAELMARDDARAHEYYRTQRTGTRPNGRLVRTIIERGYRAAAKELHPDLGGNHEGMVALNQAREWLDQQIGVLS